MELTKFIIGKYPKGERNAWKVSKTTIETLNIGDYAIVESGDDFALVKIIAMGETGKEYEKYITGHQGGINKRVVCPVSVELLNMNRQEEHDEL